MKEILIYGIAAGITFVLFIALLIFALIRKRRTILITSMFFLVISITTGIIAAYKTATKTYSKVTDILKPRTGKEIYSALFDKPNDCLKILDYQDQVVPKIDYAIWLHANTCPHELQRILSKENFDFRILSTKWMNSSGPLANDNWFKPETLGDTILVFENINKYGNGKIIYSWLKRFDLCQSFRWVCAR